MKTWQIILLLLGILLIGFVRELVWLRIRVKRINAVGEFLEKFIEWTNSQGKNYELYNWLIMKSDIIQMKLGRFGVISYRAPFGIYTTNNYAVILNAIPEINKEFHGLFPIEDSLSFHITAVDNCLRRYLGSEGEEGLGCLLNPIRLFCRGIGTFLELPVYFLEECRIISSARSLSIVNGLFFRVISGMTALLTLVSTIMTVAMGWDGFVDIVLKLLNRGKS